MSGGELQASKTERDGLVDTNGTSKRIKKIQINYCKEVQVVKRVL